ncbi:MAG: hypothetical protein JF590_08795, partial [Gemmatimonadetes bacterium]|nr:hypothetical protein [Gemmatimonadota bacterium]
MIGGRTRLFLLLGRPVAHSCSPVMQNAAFQALGLDAVYAALDCVPEDTVALARSVAHGGGGGNATVPHKTVLAAALERPSARAERLGAANVFWGDGDTLAGDNTDLDGVLESLARLEAPASTWLVIGTGGSARAVVAAAAERGARVAVRSRSSERATDFSAWASTLGVEVAAVDDCEVVINATPLGMKEGDGIPIDFGVVPKARSVLDLVYRSGET